jgi:hypothetical protein
VFSTNDQDNKNTVNNVLGPALAKCGDKIWHTYFYDQNINTAAQQVRAGIDAMDTPSNPATTVLCLCDSVAPAFVYEGEQNNNYWPENLIASDQQMDWDTTGQSYEATPASPGLACPTPAQGCEFDTAFGLSSEYGQEPSANDEGLRIFKDGGGTTLPSDFTPVNASLWARYYSMWANFIENTGPNLTAANMQARAPSLPPMGGGTTGKSLLQVSPNNWDWIQDVRVVYWDKHAKSSYNGQPGTYVQIQGPRYPLGQFPTAPNGPDIPGGRTP